MERILSSEDKIRRAEEIYYRRKTGNPSSKFSKIEGERKSYLGSKILLEVLVIINLSVIIMLIQNKDYIFTENFLSDVEKYNINITENLKEFIGMDDNTENKNEENINNEVPSFVEETSEQEEKNIQEETQEIVPNEENLSSSLNQMDEEISKINSIVSLEKPIREGTITSRFGTRESENKNVEGYHTGIDIGALKRNFNLFSNFSERLL